MLRYPATTISLTMAEVLEFERHHRLKRYLAQEAERVRSLQEAAAALQEQPVVYPAAERTSKGDELVGNDNATINVVGSEDIVLPSAEVSPRMLRALQSQLQARVDGQEELVSQSPPHRSQRTASSSGASQHSPVTATATVVTLPPPFSAGARIVSDEYSLPLRTLSRRSPDQAQGPRPGQAPPVTPTRSSSLVSQSLPASPSPTASRTRLLRSAVRFVETYVRSQGRASASPASAPSASSTVVQGERGEQREVTSQDSDPRLQVYSDFLPASMQPTTPRNLPEARHQSRFQGWYTAPIARSRQPAEQNTSAFLSRQDRAHSPSGLDTPGFRGLYGGAENADDLTLYQEASRLREDQADRTTQDGGN
ncbi:hypothetical protein SCAR479_03798 [Seiridium cardinale]|uniref:Uncharacterized protein n=1 Tax=Seiridium cardinale TaxID=138064 RepID=A0ABR2XZT5_9PEZI